MLILFYPTGGTKASAGCEKEEAGDSGEAHWDSESKLKAAFCNVIGDWLSQSEGMCEESENCVCLQLLISKLEKNKSMKAEDKAQIMQTLTALTNGIGKLQEEIKGLSSTNMLQTGIKTKAQVQTHTHIHLPQCVTLAVRF